MGSNAASNRSTATARAPCMLNKMSPSAARPPACLPATHLLAPPLGGHQAAPLERPLQLPRRNACNHLCSGKQARVGWEQAPEGQAAAVAAAAGGGGGGWG
jgi:hypothetical protein